MAKMTLDPRTLTAKMAGNDTDSETVRDYLFDLLAAVWAEGECFSGKRPFGNSGWEYDIYDALAAAGVIKSKRIDDCYDHDDKAAAKARQQIALAIESLRVETAPAKTTAHRSETA